MRNFDVINSYLRGFCIIKLPYINGKGNPTPEANSLSNVRNNLDYKNKLWHTFISTINS